jgi:iron complex transport system ATP-binding protein
MSIINCTDVSFYRNEVPLLHNVNWQVEESENWAILGLNGAGKSLLLQLVTGQLWPSRGQLEVLGNVFGECSIPELQQRVAWVSGAFMNSLPGYEKTERIVLSGYFNSVGIHKEFTEAHLNAAKEILVRMGMEQLIGKQYQVLSQGQRQMVAIARALINRPEVLILDEPTNGLDLFAREELLSRIHDLIERKIVPTLILVTHHTEEITPDFNKIMMLRQGEVIHQGNREDCFKEDILTDFYQRPVGIMPYTEDRVIAMPKEEKAV